MDMVDSTTLVNGLGMQRVNGRCVLKDLTTLHSSNAYETWFYNLANADSKLNRNWKNQNSMKALKVIAVETYKKCMIYIYEAEI